VFEGGGQGERPPGAKAPEKNAKQARRAGRAVESTGFSQWKTTAFQHFPPRFQQEKRGICKNLLLMPFFRTEKCGKRGEKVENTSKTVKSRVEKSRFWSF
jgi:hypothetical protein